jgi:membrane-associated protein
MSINDQILAAFSIYGLPVLFGVTLISTFGIPFPGTLLLIVAGSFVQLGDLNLGWTLLLATVAAVLGDQLGYGIGRLGGHRLATWAAARLRMESRLPKAEAIVRKWGGPGIFFSRWLLIAVGPWINFISGISEYSYPRFLFWDILGEAWWVVMFVVIGEVFSDRVQAFYALLGNLVWVIFGLAAAILFGWLLARTLKNGREKKGKEEKGIGEQRIGEKGIKEQGMGEQELEGED